MSMKTTNRRPDGMVAASTGGTQGLLGTESTVLVDRFSVRREGDGRGSGRRQRLARSHKPKPIEPTRRDLEELLPFIARIGCATPDALQDLAYGRWPSLVRDRLRRLYDNRFLNKLGGRAASEPDIYFLSPSARRGWPVVEAHLVAAGQRPRSLPHTSKIAETIMQARVIARVLRAARDSGLSASNWRPEPELRGLHCFSQIIPDGYIRIAREPDADALGGSLLLEVEARASAIRTWQARFSAYTDLYESGRYQETFKTDSLRVLVVLTGSAGRAARLRTLSDAALIQEATMVRLAHWEILRAVPAKDVLLSPLWTKPGVQEPLSLFGKDLSR